MLLLLIMGLGAFATASLLIMLISNFLDEDYDRYMTEHDIFTIK